MKKSSPKRREVKIYKGIGHLERFFNTYGWDILFLDRPTPPKKVKKTNR